MQSTDREAIILVESLTAGYNHSIVLSNVSFSVRAGEIFTVLGPSGCGKTTLFKVLIGLIPSAGGRVLVAGEEISGERSEEALSRARRQIGVLFQSGALIDSLTIAENVALPIRERTNIPERIIRRMVQIKLDLVKLGDDADLMPAELSGGMTKRAGLARAMALDPLILFCDEPSAGLDPVTALEIDELLLELNEHVGITVVVITHEVASVENLSGNCIVLNCEAKGIIASGTLDDLRKAGADPRVQAFFQRKITGKAPGERAT